MTQTCQFCYQPLTPQEVPGVFTCDNRDCPAPHYAPTRRERADAVMQLIDAMIAQPCKSPLDELMIDAFKALLAPDAPHRVLTTEPNCDSPEAELVRCAHCNGFHAGGCHRKPTNIPADKDDRFTDLILRYERGEFGIRTSWVALKGMLEASASESSNVLLTAVAALEIGLLGMERFESECFTREKELIRKALRQIKTPKAKPDTSRFNGVKA